MVHSVTFKRPSSQAISQRDPVQPPIKKAKVNGSRQEVFGGVAWKTRHGVTQEDLLIHNGRLITKHELDKYRRQFVNNGFARWMAATVCARMELRLKGFVSVARETSLYSMTKAFYDDPSFMADGIVSQAIREAH